MMAMDPSSLPRKRDQLLLVTDRAAAPADFIMASTLVSHLRSTPTRMCVFVSFSEAFSHWKTIASRLNPSANLSAHISNGTLVYVDALAEMSMYRNSPSSSSLLRRLYEKVLQALAPMEAVEETAANDTAPGSGPDGCHSSLVILDGLSVIEWTGALSSPSEITRFVRAMRALCHKCNASLLIRHHILANDDLDDLMRFLLLACAWHVQVLPLSTGRSGDISGEIAIYRGPLLGEDDVPDKITIQYRLTDSGATYFHKGTSVGVL